MIMCHQLIILIFLLIHKFQENKLVISYLLILWVRSCYSSSAVCSSVTRHLLFFCHLALTMFLFPLTCMAPTNFLLSLVFLIFLSVASNRSSMHYVITILADSCTPLHNHNSTFPLATFVTSCWSNSLNLLHQSNLLYQSNQLSDSTWII